MDLHNCSVAGDLIASQLIVSNQRWGLLTFYGEQGVREFESALLALTGEDDEIPALPAAEEIEEVEEPAIEVAVAAEGVHEVEVDSESAPETVEEVGESQGEKVALDFTRLSWAKLRKLAQSKGVLVKGKKRDDLLNAIAHVVTQDEIDQAA